MSEDFVGRVRRIEISDDVADYLVGAFELFDRMRGQRMPALPPRLRAIHRALRDACTGVDASSITAGRAHITGVHASAEAVAAVDVSHSAPRRVNTTQAAQMLQMTTNGVRDRCRENALDWVKPGTEYLITLDSIEQYKARRRPRERSKG